MPRHTLYAYADGADLEDVAEILEARFTEFATSREWRTGRASVVNQRHGDETCTRPGDLPLWDLGLTLALPDPGGESVGWFADVEAVAQFLGTLHRDFVIGIAETVTGITGDLFAVSTDSPDLGGCAPSLELRTLSETPPNNALQQIRSSHTGCNPHVPHAASTSLGRYIMSTVFTFLALCLAFLFAGCANSQSSGPRADAPEVIEQVRSRVLELPTLDTASREIVRTTAPKIWFVSLPFGGDYTFQWRITSNRTVELHAANGLKRFSDRALIREPVASRY